MVHAREDYNRIQDPARKIPAEEPVFLLRAQDRTAVATLKFWITENERLPDKDQRAIDLARGHLKRMEEWPVKKTADC